MARAKRAAAKAIRPPKPPAAVRRILSRLERQHPGALTALHFRNAYELLVATILSAQCTDERVNQVTPALFARYPDARALARVAPEDLEPLIKPTGFFRAKARTLVAMARALVERHGGDVPPRMEDLVRLPGVGRKTANVVLGHAFGVPALAVDRHVLRVANRIGVANSDDPEVVEAQLCAALPPEKWTIASDTLILHGRRICRPKPLCDRCAVREDCDFFRSGKAGRAGGGVAARPQRVREGVAEQRGERKRAVAGRGGGAPRQAK